MADHFGVVKALLDSNLLPRVIAGTSSGSLIAAFVCTRTDEELKTLLNPSLAKRITACEESFRSWFRRFLQTGARFDTVDWARKASNVLSIVSLPADLSTYRQYSGPGVP